jgi:hypothetical protein
VFPEVADLATYPEWLGIVLSARREEGSGEPSWAVEIGARLGPLRRGKRLRMVRTEHLEPTSCRFERRELDGHEHSAWVLSAGVAPGPDGSELTMDLRYEGGLWLPGLDRVLDAEIAAAGRRLRARLA